MRKSMKEALKTSVESLLDVGADVSFTDRELKLLGIKISEVQIPPKKIKNIRKETHYSQSVFAKILNVSLSTVRQWEQGKRKPTGSSASESEVQRVRPGHNQHRHQHCVRNGGFREAPVERA